MTTPVTSRPLGPYEFIATPPVQLVLNAILELASVGGSITPGIRELAKAARVSRGLITDCLRQLAADDWILYDGRVITLLRHPDEAAEADRSPDLHDQDAIDHLIDQATTRAPADRSPDRSRGVSPLVAAVQRASLRRGTDAPADRSPDRSAQDALNPPLDPPMVIHVLATADSVAAHEMPTIGGSGGMPAADRSTDRSHPAAQLMAELGANPVIIADALAARPDLTAQQVRDTWEHFQRRIETGRVNPDAGAFYDALRAGQIHGPPRDLRLDPRQYAANDAYLLGSAAPPTDPIRDRAERITPPTISTADFLFVMQQLAAGASDDQALDALAQRQARRGGRL